MKFKRLLAFVISMSLVVGSVQSLVLANEVGFSADDTEVAETTEAPKEESESKDKKSSESDGEKKSKTEEKKPEPEEEKVSESKEDKQSEVKDEKEPEIKAEEPEAKEDKEPETKEENPEVKEDKEPETKEEEPEVKEPETKEEQEPETEDEEFVEEKEDLKPGNGYAAKEPEAKTRKSDSTENDKLFNQFAEKLIYPDRYATRKAASFAGSNLTGANKTLYTELKSRIIKVANGTLTESHFVVTVKDTGIEYINWTKDQLGIESFYEQGYDGKIYLNTYASLAVLDKMNLDLQAVHYALLSDCPSELYWYDKTTGMYLLPRVSISPDGQSGCYTGTMDAYFYAAEAYMKDPAWGVQNGKVKTVKNAISNAKK